MIERRLANGGRVVARRGESEEDVLSQRDRRGADLDKIDPFAGGIAGERVTGAHEFQPCRPPRREVRPMGRERFPPRFGPPMKRNAIVFRHDEVDAGRRGVGRGADHQAGLSLVRPGQLDRATIVASPLCIRSTVWQ